MAIDSPKNAVDKRITPEFRAQAGKGRPKGVPNKNTTALKDMILKALDGAGGAEYLQRQAEENPGPFLSLVGKVLPLQVTGEGGGAVKIESITGDMTPAQAAEAYMRMVKGG